ncbi:MAG TPA: hypothetical protein PK668_04615 [Myxococcota bacterium]|nr:hypothetical protein [Myxococcota bacterium]HRY92143.1 hypothetical protein [Myxococcota bacterium]HSA23124.1 hypothetical protein [Myxococcota bacterium]
MRWFDRSVPPRPRRALAAAVLALALLGLAPGAARAEVSMSGWYFPLPFTLNSPTTPHRFGGILYSMTFADGGVGLAFPLWSIITNEAQTFVVDLGFPLAIGVPDEGDASFYGGNIRVGMYGSWHFTMPFGDNIKLPAAWSVGGEVGLPTAGIWGGNAAYHLNYPMYVHDPIGWVPEAFGFRPRAMLAIGKPIFYTQFDFSLVNLADFGGAYMLSPSWGFALGSNPHEMVSISVELGGVHWVTPDREHDVALGDKVDQVWTAFGCRLYFGQFTLGVMGRVPFLDMFGAAESIFSFQLFAGYELRSKEPF